MRRKAFTLLEVLTVIAIIAILVTLVTLGVGHINKASKRNATLVTMQNLKSLLTERELSGGLGAVNGLYPSQTTVPPPPIVLSPLPAPGDVKEGGVDRRPVFSGNQPWPQNCSAAIQVGATQMAMNALQAIPKNKAMIAGLPSSSMWNPKNNVEAPIPLDAWGNPIIYVPPGGLTNLYVAGQPTAKRSPDGRGFWASAGPDGVFGGFHDKNGNGTYDAGVDTDYGDDNIYSCDP